MEPYKEVNFGWILLVFMVPGQVLITYLYFSGAGDKPLTFTPFIIISVLFITVTLIFYRLKVSVWTDTILISFGIGLIWTTIDVSRIESIKVVKNPFYYGWGIRMIPKGTMYNISGTKAIELGFRDSHRIIRIGSRQPDKLKQVIEERLKILKPRG